jgi:peptidoglycan/LPS O-acetylase OafA/YrhL
MANLPDNLPIREDERVGDCGEPRKKNRLDYLDGLRGLAALIVVTHHGLLAFDFAIYSGQAKDSHFGWDIGLSGLPFFLPNAGNFAVCVFFVLSGFVLSRSFSRTDLTAIASVIKRYLRLTIPITAANLVALVVGISAVIFPAMAGFIPPLTGVQGNGRSLGDILPAMGFCLRESLYKATITGVGPVTFNGALWTMPIEFQGSLILILIQLLSRLGSASERGRRIWAAVLAFIFLALSWNSYLGLFGAGALLYSAFNFGVLRATRRFVALQYCLLIVALFLGTMPFSVARARIYNGFVFWAGPSLESVSAKSVYHPVLAALRVKDWVPYPVDPVVLWHSVGAMLLLGCLCLSTQLQNGLSLAPFRFLGKISFPLYLIHPIVRRLVGDSTMQAALRHRWSYGHAMMLAIAAFIPAAILAGYLLGALAEERSIRWSGRVGAWIDRRLGMGLLSVSKKGGDSLAL